MSLCQYLLHVFVGASNYALFYFYSQRSIPIISIGGKLSIMKLAIWVGIFIGGTLGGWVGALMTNGNWFSITSILLSGVGSILGVWAGYRFAKAYL
jgi:hypothetical protein